MSWPAQFAGWLTTLSDVQRDDALERAALKEFDGSIDRQLAEQQTTTDIMRATAPVRPLVQEEFGDLGRACRRGESPP